MSITTKTQVAVKHDQRYVKKKGGGGSIVKGCFGVTRLFFPFGKTFKSVTQISIIKNHILYNL